MTSISQNIMKFMTTCVGLVATGVVYAEENAATVKAVKIQSDNLSIVDQQVRELTAKLNDLTIFMYVATGIMLTSLIIFALYFAMNYNNMASTVRKLKLKNENLNSKLALQNEKLMGNMLRMQRNLGEFTEKQLRMSSEIKDLQLSTLTPRVVVEQPTAVVQAPADNNTGSQTTQANNTTSEPDKFSLGRLSEEPQQKKTLLKV